MHASNILCATDFDASSRVAFDAALELSRASGGGMTVLHVFPLPASVYMPMYPQSRLGDLRLLKVMEGIAGEQLEQLAGEARAKAVPMRRHCLVGDPARTIATFARRHHHDLIVVGLHRRAWLTRLFLGGLLSERIVRMAPCPVLVVPTPAAPVRALTAAR